MSGVLVIAEARRGEVRSISLELIECGRRLKEQGAGPLVVGLASKDPYALANRLDVAGVDELLLVQTPNAHFEAHAAGHALEALIAETSPAVVVLGHTIDAIGYGPAVAAGCALGFAADALAVDWEERVVVRRGAYGARLVARVEFPGSERILVMVRAGAYEPAGGAGSARIRTLDVDIDPGVVATEHLGFREIEETDIDITGADVVVSVGRGVASRETLAKCEELADRLGAAVGVSRPLVDAGWVPRSRAVGQSAKTVKPKVYLALGISGAAQHVAGIREAETIIAINTDQDAPIFQVAHYGSHSDLREVVEAMLKRLESRG